MKVSRTKLASLIADQTLKSGISNSLPTDVAKIIVKSRITNSVNSLMRDVMNEWAKRGFLEIVARSSFPLNKKTENEIIKEIKKHYPNVSKISIVWVNDPSVIGGVRIELSDKQLDLTIQTKINKFKQYAISGKD